MGHDHSSTAVSFATDLIHGITSMTLLEAGHECLFSEEVSNLPIVVVLVEQLEVAFPEVCDDFAAREAADWDDHLG